MNARFALVPAALALLAGCGNIIGSFVPPQDFDPGLKGATLSSSGLQKQSVAGTLAYNSDGSQTFGDFSVDNRGIVPRHALVQLAFATASVNPTCLSAPASFTATVSEPTIVLSDPGRSATIANTSSVELTLTRNAGGSYSVAANSLTLQADEGQTRAAFSVATGGGINTAKIGAKITSPSDGLAGCTLTFGLGDVKGTFSNFGN